MSEKIILIRSRFEEELKKNSSLYDPVDIKRVRTEDWQIQRYLLGKKLIFFIYFIFCQFLFQILIMKLI